MKLLHETLPRLDCTIHYWTDGPASTPRAVFTHGATVDHREWDATGSILNVVPVWAELEPFAEPVIIRSPKHAPNLDRPDAFHKRLPAFLSSQTGESQATPHEGG
jgi:pimeloyl-ACP methyl ester carboxylesterase